MVHYRERDVACAQVAALREALENARESMAFLRSCLYSGEGLDSDDIKHIDDVFAEIRAALAADARHGRGGASE